jgi:hypothetical protein
VFLRNKILQDHENSLPPAGGLSWGISSSMPLLVTDQLPPHWGNAPLIVHFKMENEI